MVATNKHLSGWEMAGLSVLVVVVGLCFLLEPTHATDLLREDTAVVAVVNEEGDTLDQLMVSISSTPLERYLGLSETERLDTGTGMWFVYPAPDTRAFVMRGMKYPLDIVFVDEARKITTIHSAPVEDTKPLTRYRGWGQWILEVPMGWAKQHGVKPGDRVLTLREARKKR